MKRQIVARQNATFANLYCSHKLSPTLITLLSGISELPSSSNAAVMVAFFFIGISIMHRTNHTHPNTPSSPQELQNHIAFHESGHITAIYIRNREQQLPPVFFQIIINKNQENYYPFFAQVVGGRLIDNLPVAEIEKNYLGTEEEKKSLQQAYEADVINLLTGPLAEAKYVSLRDDEIFNLQLVNIVALKNYGGHSDLEKAYRYLEYFIPSEAERELKVNELFTKAFRFVDDQKNWHCIQTFANYLLNNKQTSISCEQASVILEPFVALDA